ncbi:hypothetical protein [Actinoplanes sp. N902-109]|uniref:hypothetical protein n=1 Tax=Actinoplanes sp. (strain N902-109) TaxID=649831 RepID=UPI0003293FDC|nr:hypothetical protein [Actinoplanes sp. N902-109]AGL15928.1 hypothetical protein L083_2418 [Actinoplanes sp. N902-109]
MTAERELELRYRRLLAVYPGWYRREYEDEMVTVLLAGAGPGARRPGLPDRLNLLAGALAVRIRHGSGTVRAEPWRRAARVGQLLGVLLLLGIGLRRLAAGFTYTITLADGYPRYGAPTGLFVSTMDVVRPAVWALALATVLIGWRWLTLGLTVAGAVVEIGHVGSWYSESPSRVLLAAWLLTVAVLMAGVSGWLVTGEPGGAPMRARWFGGAFAVALAGGAVDYVQNRWGHPQFPFPSPWDWAVTIDDDYVFRWATIPMLAGAALAVRGWWLLDGPVRRRLVVLAVPVVAVAVEVSYGFAGFMFSSQRATVPHLLAPFQWAILGVTPVLAFALGVVVLGRWERVTHLIRLGLRSERGPAAEQPAPVPETYG